MLIDLPGDQALFARFDAIVPAAAVSQRAVEQARRTLAERARRPRPFYLNAKMALAASLLLMIGLGALLLVMREGADGSAQPSDVTARSVKVPLDHPGARQPPETHGGMDMMPWAVPIVYAHSAEHASVLVANGGKDPVRLGSTTREGGGLLHVWDWSKSPLSRVVPKVEFWGTERVALSPDGRRLVWARGVILDLQTEQRTAIDLGGANIRIGESTYARIGDMKFSPDGGRLAFRVTNLDDKQPGRVKSEVVQIVEFPSGRHLCEFPAGEPYALRTGFSEDGKFVVAADPGRQVLRRDAATGTVLTRYAPSLSSQVMGVALSPDGKYVAAVQREPGDLYLWDADSGRLLHRIEGATFEKSGAAVPVSEGALRFSPDGKHLAAAYWGRLFVINVSTGEVAAALPESWATSIQWSADGTTLTTVSPVVVGKAEPGGRLNWYPSVHEWDWRNGKRSSRAVE